jgi:hypothetical protein
MGAGKGLRRMRPRTMVSAPKSVLASISGLMKKSPQTGMSEPCGPMPVRPSMIMKTSR